MIEPLTIARLGAQGDGIAETGAGPLYVPFTLPGEVVEADASRQRAAPRAILRPSPERIQPPCPHFGICGGCDLQHASEALYRGFKRGRVVEALRREAIEAEVAELVSCPPASRRRAVFSAARAGGDMLFGYNQALSHDIVPIEVCPITVPAIVSRLGELRRLAAILIDRKRGLRVTVTATASGLDVAVADAARLNERLRQTAIRQAIAAGFARLSVAGEVLVETRTPVVDIDGIAVELPPGGFLQAVASAETVMARQVLAHLAGSRQVADLFSGIGTFALRLARSAAVHAVETDGPALAALDRARRGASGLKPVTVERRDLFRRPLTAKELNRFGGVVFDPPRAGTEAQSRELAASRVPRIAAVSCNPATFARDVRILQGGGYRLLSVTPIDQFLWSHHVEAVALLER